MNKEWSALIDWKTIYFVNFIILKNKLKFSIEIIKINSVI